MSKSLRNFKKQFQDSRTSQKQPGKKIERFRQAAVSRAKKKR
jgi:hypothetical protein